MKSFKSVVAIAAVGVFLLMGAFSHAEETQQTCTIMTTADLADALIKALGITMPEGTEGLSGKELFEAQANILAAKGIDIFDGASPDAQVTKGEVWDLFNKALVMFAQTRVPEGTAARGATAALFNDSLIGYGVTTIEDEIAYLESLGFGDPAKKDETACSEDVLAALNFPGLNEAIAEGYSPPRGVHRIGIPPQNPIPEEPAGPIPPAPTAEGSVSECRGDY